MKSLVGVVGLVSIAGLACSSALAPPSQVTLLVTNASCQTGPCDSLEILAFPVNQPTTPGGYWSLDLGLITTQQACVTLPASARFLIIGVNADGTRDTTSITWTTAVAVSLGAQSPSASRIQASPSTTSFVPSSSAGWSITLPTESDPRPSGACVSANDAASA